MRADAVLMIGFGGPTQPDEMRPLLRDTIAQMNRDSIRAAVGVIMAPHRSPTSWDRYQLDVQRAREDNGGGPEVTYLEPWHQHPLFLEAMAQRIEERSGRTRGA